MTSRAKSSEKHKKIKNKKWLTGLIFQRFVVILLILLQLAILIFLISSVSRKYTWVSITLTVVSLLIVLSIIPKNEKGAYKFTWAIFILVFPVFGGLFYLFFHIESGTNRFKNKLKEADEAYKKYFLSRGNFLPGICQTQCNEKNIKLMKYLHNFAGYPVFPDSDCKYLKIGEEYFEEMLSELKKAEKYIFLEYFILSEGYMWDALFEVLREKAAAGVDVRLIYDDVGCFLRLPKNFAKELSKHKIKAVAFNAIHPMLTTKQNNRDHRKITVIDGKVAFTGGINIADEYINHIERFGHWKDAGIKIEGAAVWSFVLFFLQMWFYCTKEREDDLSRFYPDNLLQSRSELSECNTDGLVQPYADSPADKENVGEHVYLEVIGSSKKYLYITTPYLIIDDTMLSALKLAAKSGVDVVIITPHIWDKRLVHFTTQSYYRELIEAGVKIFEYTPGFIHSKIFVSDDSVATVGMTNMDFRSLYLHFECGAVIYDKNTIADIKDDFLETLKESQQISIEQCKKSFPVRLIQNIVRLFAPLM